MRPTAFLLILCVLSAREMYSQTRYVTVDSTDIWVNIRGIEERKTGQPLIVFESGLGTPMDNWDSILEGVKTLAPILTYDRPGIGKSEADHEMPTIKHVADKLVNILHSLELEPPYILVGHSLGGAYVRGFATHYPELLAGLVIIDPADFTETQENKRDYYEVLGWDDEKIDEVLEKIEKGLMSRRKNRPTSIQEESRVLAELRKTDFEEIRQHPLPNIPIHIITGGRFDMPIEMRSKEYDEEAIFRSKMKHRVARWTDVIQSVDKGMLLYSGDAGHFVHIDDPDLVISSIKIVLQDYEKMTKKDQHPNISQETLKESIHRFNKAFEEGDVTVLETMITSNYVHTNGHSKAIRKQDWLNYLTKRQEDIDAGKLNIISYEMDEVEIEMYGHTAIVTGKIKVSSRNKHQLQENEYRVTNIWVYESDQWKRAGFHDGKIR